MEDKEKTGIELIAQERKEQIEKHRRTVDLDVEYNKYQQLVDAAIMLSQETIHELSTPPYSWDAGTWGKMVKKPYKERLIIAGALIAAELDRLQAIGE